MQQKDINSLADKEERVPRFKDSPRIPWLKALIAQKATGPKDFGLLVGIDHGTMSLMLNGWREISDKQVRKIIKKWPSVPRPPDWEEPPKLEEVSASPLRAIHPDPSPNVTVETYIRMITDLRETIQRHETTIEALNTAIFRLDKRLKEYEQEAHE